MLDFLIVSPIAVKDGPWLTTLNEARVFADDMLSVRRMTTWRDMLARMDGV
jgi:hypothetical protein